MIQYVYIHGFGTTGLGSNKFKKIKAHAESLNRKAFALEWNENQDNIIKLLHDQLMEVVNLNDPICLIGSSTGGNFTYQLLPLLKKNVANISFILINPLVNVAQRKIENLNFPISLANQLKMPNNETKNGLILLGKKDEVLDAFYTNEILNATNKIIIGEDWNHTLSNLETKTFLSIIDDFIK